MANGGDIIIKGGSVDIDFDEAKYPKEFGRPRNHKADDQTITRVTVEDAASNVKYDSNGDTADKTNWTIHVYCIGTNKPVTNE